MPLLIGEFRLGYTHMPLTEDSRHPEPGERPRVRCRGRRSRHSANARRCVERRIPDRACALIRRAVRRYPRELLLKVAVSDASVIRAKPVCSLQRPKGKPAHRPCNAQGPTAEVVSVLADVSTSHVVSGGLERGCAECDVGEFSLGLIPEALPVYKLSPMRRVDSSKLETHVVASESERRHLRRLVAWFDWPLRYVAALGASDRKWDCSTAFSGIGCAEIAGAALGNRKGMGHFRFMHAVEKDQACRSFLSSHTRGVSCSSDILNWLPDTYDRTKLQDLSFDQLRNDIVDSSLTLDYSCGTGGSFRRGDVHVAGPPCVEFSPMGLQLRERGPTRGLLVVWAKSIREQRPIIVVFENVSKYPVALLVSLFGDIYDISDAVIDACELGAPSRRLRLYCVMCLKRHMRLQRPLCDLVDVLGLVKGDRLSAQDLLFSHGPAVHLSPSASSYKKCYVKTFGFSEGFYDLSQNPSFRPRACTGSEPLFTLTTSTGIVWSVAEARCMSATELAAAQGLPSHPSPGLCVGNTAT